MMWLLVSLVLAQEPTGRLALSLSPGATVDIAPHLVQNAIEVTIRGNHVPLGDQLRDRSSSGLLDVAGISVGGGTWLVTVYPRDPSETLRAVPTADGVVFERTPRVGPDQATEAPDLTLRAVLDGATAPLGRPPTRTLLPLLGGAAASSTSAGQRLPLVAWRGEPMPPELEGTLSGATLGWDAIVRFQQALALNDDRALKQAARYRLAVAYDAMALPRESDHYLAEMQRSGDRSLPVALLRARSSARLGDWSGMRTHCDEAASADLGHVATLQCFTLYSVRTGDLSTGALGRLLRDATDDPSARALAARALLHDHHYAEALTVLRSLIDTTEQPTDDLLALWGDAELVAGALDDARDAWEAVRWDSPAGRLGRVRLLQIDMLDNGPQSWLSALPRLHVAADRGRQVGAEALHLVAQIGQRYGDPELEAIALATLLAEHRETVRGSDVTSRLVQACSERLSAFHKEERFVEEVALYERCWDHSLNDVLRDTARAQAISDAYSALGLPEQALGAQLEVARMRSRDDRPDNASTLRLATLYNAVGRAEEALDTVRYIRSRRPSGELRVPLLHQAALAHRALGDVDAAISELSRAEGTDWDARALWAELVSARDGCAAARTEFQYQAAAGREPLAMATRCLLELGDAPTAWAYRTDTAHPAHDAQSAAVSMALGNPPPARDDAPDWYQALAAEEQAFEDLRRRLNP